MNRHDRLGTFLGAAVLLLGLLVSLSAAPGDVLAQAKNKADKTGITPAPQDVNDLSMEVNALRTLYLLRGADPDSAVGIQNPDIRLQVFKNYADCAQKKEKRTQAKVSDAYRKVLVELRGALIAEDVEQIEELDKKLQDMRKDEDPDIDDRVEITDEARKRTADIVRRRCTADQVIIYLASYGKDLPNPRTLIVTAMRVKEKGPVAKKPTPEEWKEIRAFTIRETTWMLGGLNIDKGDQVGMRVGELLDKAYAMSEEELKKNAFDLRTESRLITEKVGPTDLLKHVIEQDMAELLSNPRLIPAAEARLKYLATKKKQ